jgi:hypothetical protein
VIPKPEKCTKSTQNAPNGHKISQISIKFSTRAQNISAFSNLRPSKIYPNWFFLFQKKPSGNPAQNCQSVVSSGCLTVRATSSTFTSG